MAETACTVASDARLLLVTPCDPGNCHIYFSVQRRALPTALALARATNRTLVLPPLEWYADQAQMFANKFLTTPQGSLPRFKRWSDLFDISHLRRHTDIIEFDDLISAGDGGGGGAMPALTIDRAVHQRGNTPNYGGELRAGEPLSGSRFAEKPCKQASLGLLRNLSWPPQEDDSGLQPTLNAGGQMYGQQVAVRELRCGTLQLSSVGASQALAGWFADVRLAAVFDVGHHTHTKLEARPRVAASHPPSHPATPPSLPPPAGPDARAF